MSAKRNSGLDHADAGRSKTNPVVIRSMGSPSVESVAVTRQRSGQAVGLGRTVSTRRRLPGRGSLLASRRPRAARSYSGPSQRICNVGQVANLPEMRQIGNLPHIGMLRRRGQSHFRGGQAPLSVRCRLRRDNWDSPHDRQEGTLRKTPWRLLEDPPQRISPAHSLAATRSFPRPPTGSLSLRFDTADDRFGGCEETSCGP